MPWEIIIFQGVNGLIWGLILSLIAVGLCLIFGFMRLMNLAHGSLYMLGAVIGYALLAEGMNFWLGLVLVPILIASISVGLNEVLFQRLSRHAVTTGLLATAGLMLVIDNAVLATFGSIPEVVSPPIHGSVTIFGFYYPAYRLIVAGIAAATLLGLWSFLRFTRYGLWMRAVPQGRELASALGVPIRRVSALTVAIGGLTAGIAGILVMPISGAYYQMGLNILAAAFIVVVAGGLGSLFGAVAIAVILGVSRGLFAAFWPPTVAEVLSFTTVLAILLFRPEGLFSTRGK